MSINGIEAGQAYAQALARKADATPSAAGEATPSFSDLVRDVVADGMEAARASESAGIQAAAGQGELLDVVTAVANAELTLETVVAIRDQVIQAYQDVIRMPI